MPIVTSKELTRKSQDKLAKFQSGEIQPVKSGDPQLDDQLLEGYIPGIIHTIAGISGSGKSYRLQEVENHVLKNYEDVIVLRHNWEMTHLKLFLRRVHQETGLPLKEILYKPFTGDVLRIYNEVVKSESHPHLFYSPDPLDPEKFYEELGSMLEEWKDLRVMVSVDHAGLAKDKTGGGQKKSADDLITMVNLLNKQHEYIFWLILIQMNRKIEDRTDPRHHKPLRGDLYATDTLYHLSDMVEVVHNPWSLGIERYMSFRNDRYAWMEEFKHQSSGRTTSFQTEGVLFHHFIKSRLTEMFADAPDMYARRIYTPNPEPGQDQSGEETEQKVDKKGQYDLDF